MLAEQRELKERSEREVEDVKTKAVVDVAQALANHKAAVEAAAATEARLRAELATAQEATEKVRCGTVVLAAVSILYMHMTLMRKHNSSYVAVAQSARTV